MLMTPGRVLLGGGEMECIFRCQLKKQLLAVTLWVCFFPHRFDQDGMYLITGGDDKNVFVLDARPSSNFTCLGFTGEISHLYNSHTFFFLVCGGH